MAKKKTKGKTAKDETESKKPRSRNKQARRK